MRSRVAKLAAGRKAFLPKKAEENGMEAKRTKFSKATGKKIILKKGTGSDSKNHPPLLRTIRHLLSLGFLTPVSGAGTCLRVGKPNRKTRAVQVKRDKKRLAAE